MEKLYYTFVHFDGNDYPMVASDKGLVYVGGELDGYQGIVNWVQKHRKGAELEENTEKLKPFQQQLEEYFTGKRTVFDLPLDVSGTPFQISTWEALKEIPFGETKTYGEIATAIGNPKAVRAVGTAIGSNPISIIVPCHRVIGKDGRLTGYGNGLPMKKRLLMLEDVFIEK
ncbi:methylated-DNA--[protein]-cysteine S-methyltransferase [Pisciglobus halotolerans]|uniref:Methylated-DNA--protein-cysteine methyltransferase n=1 Tax=Pisciglobus halotolerans TaxID=745365 RepID=A0A1I3B615_9LACT|nr:methylated-DNA--[protein]-cysteine S-methyltransferase [Pisciglobus halotolerans]SFH57409.1 methylated-DNA-[protein]-cysteine S-methyltransferase [Pisciglobus halotolerans]